MTAHVQEKAPAPAEDCSGTAWRAPELRPDPPALPPRYRPCTPEEQAEHLAALLKGIDGYVVGPRGRTHQEER